MISPPPETYFFPSVSQYFLPSRPVTFPTSKQRSPNPYKRINKNTALKIAWMNWYIIRAKTLYSRRVFVCACIHTLTFFSLNLFLELHIYLLVEFMFSRWLTVTNVVLRNIAVCSLIGSYRLFDVTCWLCLKNRRVLLYEYTSRKNAWECCSEEYICI
jgi:hypothetical protein